MISKEFKVKGIRYCVTDDEEVERYASDDESEQYPKKYVIMQYYPEYKAWCSTRREADSLEEAKIIIQGN